MNNKQNSKTDNKTKTINKINSKTGKESKIKGESWNIESILAGQSFESLLKFLKSKTETFKNYRKELNNNISSETFIKIMRDIENIHVTSIKLQTYASLHVYENSKDSNALAKVSQLKQANTEIANDIMFFSLWFMHLEDNVAKRFISDKNLQSYKYYLEELRRLKAYTKSEDIERLLNIKDTNGIGAFSDIYDIITSGFLYDWEKKQVPEEIVRASIMSPDPEKRKEAYDKILDKHTEHATVLSEIYKDIVIEWYNDGIKIRNYKNSINIRNVSNDISDKAVDTLLSVIKKNAKIFGEYFKLKYEINIKNGRKYPYSRYHLYAPFPLKLEKKYDYETSKKIVLDVYKNFDERFYNNALTVLNSNHIHSHPQKDKRGGAFCMGIHTKITPYMMLNHTDSLRDVFIMAHELGHTVHYVFAEKCTDLTYHAAIPIAETASVFSEMLLADKMLKESRDIAEKQYIIIQSLDNQFATILRQAYFTIFEKFSHEKVIEGINTEILNQKWLETLKEQFGDMEVPEKFKHEWLYVSHLFNSPFYCYGYAWGNLFVLALYDMYKKDGKKFIDKYIELLSAGGSDSPANLMKRIGADPESEEFWQRGFNIIKKEIDELRKLSK